MGIRYEKDTILNWINEMGKFLRLITDQWQDGLGDIEKEEMEEGYTHFFQKDRAYFQDTSYGDIQKYVAESLADEQIRPLALMLMYDGFSSNDRDLLQKAKGLFEYYTSKTGSFSFEDFGHLEKIGQRLMDV